MVKKGVFLNQGAEGMSKRERERTTVGLRFIEHPGKSGSNYRLRGKVSGFDVLYRIIFADGCQMYETLYYSLGIFS